MSNQDSHLSDRQLLLELDGELSAHEAKLVLAHLEACWKCRARRQELESAIGDYVRVSEREFPWQLPPGAGPRALLRARLAELSASQPRRPAGGFAWSLAGVACGVVLALILLVFHPAHARAVVISVPDSRLTPGAALLENRQMVCTEANTKNKMVPVALQRKVFDAYGIPSAGPGEYEVDYLITPALGGADDIHNLWPQSYSATVWNAAVKDSLEDRLREMVCDGALDLREAQQEIAVNWIAAYKKYFHTDRPLPQDRRLIQ